MIGLSIATNLKGGSMKQRIIIMILIGLSSILMLGFTYPVKWMRITSTFGESREDHLHNGIDIFGADMSVYSVLPGQLVFEWQQSDYPDEQSLGYGNYVIIQHSEKYRTFYYHLKDGSIPPNLVSVSEGFQIGLTGNSGHSAGPHLHFTIVDLQNSTAINPLGLMTELHDQQKPVIQSVSISMTGEKRLLDLNPTASVVSGSHIELFLKAYDRRNNMGNHSGIYAVLVKTNGNLFLDRYFDQLATIPELTHSKRSVMKYDDVYTKDGLYKLGGMVVATNTVISISVSDFNKNTNTVVKSITTRRK